MWCRFFVLATFVLSMGDWYLTDSLMDNPNFIEMNPLLRWVYYQYGRIGFFLVKFLMTFVGCLLMWWMLTIRYDDIGKLLFWITLGVFVLYSFLAIYWCFMLAYVYVVW